MREGGKVVTRTMLLERVWNYHFDPQTNIVDTHISRFAPSSTKGAARRYRNGPRRRLSHGATMRSWRRSAAYRIAFANFAAYAIGIALLGTVLFCGHARGFQRQLNAMISDEAPRLPPSIERRRPGELGEAISDREAPPPNRMLYAVFDPTAGEFMALSGTTRRRSACMKSCFSTRNEGPDSARGLTIDCRRMHGSSSRSTAIGSKIRAHRALVFAAGFLLCLLGFAGAILLGGYLDGGSIRSAARPKPSSAATSGTACRSAHAATNSTGSRSP